MQRSRVSSYLKSIKYEQQHCISSINSSVSINISIFWGAQFKKAPGAICKWFRFQKNFGFPIFLAKDKNLTLKQIEIPK